MFTLIERFTYTPATMMLIVVMSPLGNALGASEPAEAPPSGGSELYDFLESEQETIQIATTKTGGTADEAPAQITVLTGRQLRMLGYRSLADALRYIVGFYALDDFVAPDFSVRGLSGGLGSESGLLKVMINGQSIAYRFTSGSIFDHTALPIGAIDRVEIVRGPTSSLYGADAFAGVINIILKRGRSDTEGKGQDAVTRRGGGGSVLVYGGPLREVDGYGGELVAQAFDGRLEVMGAVAHGEETLRGLRIPSASPAPRVPSYNRDRGSAADLDRRTQSAVASLRLRLDDDDQSSVYAQVYYLQYARDGEFSRFSHLSEGIDSSGRQVGTVVAADMLTVSLGATYVFTDWLQASLRASYFHGGPTHEDTIEVGSDLFYLEREYGYNGGEGLFELTLRPLPGLSIVAGSELVYDVERLPVVVRMGKEEGQELDRTAPPVATQDLWNVGVFVQGTWRVFEQYLSVTGGLRYDYHAIYGNQLNGRAALVSQPLEELTLKLIYSSAFRAPSPFLLYAEPLFPGDVVGNPNLRPQTIHSVELWGSVTPVERMTFSTGVTASMVFDKAEFVPRGLNLTAENISAVNLWSWESVADVRVLNGLHAQMGVDLVWGRRDLGVRGYQAQLIGDANSVYPMILGRAGLTIDAEPWFDWLPIALIGRGIYVGERLDSDANILARGDAGYLADTVQLDVVLRARLGAWLDDVDAHLMAGLYNATDARGPDPCYSGINYPLRRREFRLSLGANF